MVVWAGLSEEDFFELMKEIQYSYDKDALWIQYKQLKNQKDYLILNIKAHTYQFVLSSTSTTLPTKLNLA